MAEIGAVDALGAIPQVQMVETETNDALQGSQVGGAGGGGERFAAAVFFGQIRAHVVGAVDVPLAVTALIGADFFFVHVGVNEPSAGIWNGRTRPGQRPADAGGAGILVCRISGIKEV